MAISPIRRLLSLSLSTSPSPSLSLSLAVALTAAATFASAAMAQLLGPEFLVNSYTTSGQTYPAIASDGDGDFVVVWRSGGQDGSGYGIFGQRFDASGARAGSEFQVNTYTTLDQYAPAVASDGAGNFVVVWQQFAYLGSEANLFGQRFDTAGNPAGGEFQVNTSTSSRPWQPDIAADGLGNFIVVWENHSEVVLRRFASDGTPLGGDVQVNTFTTDYQGFPVVVASAGGNFVVVWQSYGQDGSNWGLFGQRFDSAGSPLGGEFPVNSYTTQAQQSAAVAAGPAGDFVVVWTATSGFAEFEIVGRRFDSAGIPVGGEFPVNTYTTSYQLSPSIAPEPGGGFVVAWDSAGQDGSYSGIFGQRFDESGLKLGSEFRVNTTTNDFQTHSSVAAGAAGTFVVAWYSDQDQEEQSSGVFAQRLPAAIFADSFEAEDVCGWSFVLGSGDSCP